MKKEKMSTEENRRRFMSEFHPDGIIIERDGKIMSLSELGQSTNKESIINEIQEHITATMTELNTNNKIGNPILFSFKCSDLVDPKPDKFTKFTEKMDNSCPTIYWFEISSIRDIKSLTDGIETCRKKNDFKVPPTNKNTSDSNILYVGKIKNSSVRALLQRMQTS